MIPLWSIPLLHFLRQRKNTETTSLFDYDYSPNPEMSDAHHFTRQNIPDSELESILESSVITEVGPYSKTFYLCSTH